MKRILALALLAAPLGSSAQVAPSVIVDRGPNHRTWGRIQEVQTPRGLRYRTNNVVVALEMGAHRWDSDRKDWVETSPRIEPFKDGAVVRGLQYSVIFAPNLASSGAVDIQMMDGQRLTGHLLGLAFTEGEKSVMIAEVTDCTAEIVGAEQNELIFRNAFTDFAIDVKYTAARHKFSQDLIIRERLPSPTRFGLTENARLEVLTEWVAAPAPQRQVRVVEAAREGQSSLTDEAISFGTMVFGKGRAFAEGSDTADIAVSKSWEQMRDDAGNVRIFLVEKVPWSKMAPELQKLPPRQASLRPPSSTRPSPSPVPPRPPSSIFNSASSSRQIVGLPAPRQKRPALKPIQMASADVPGSRLAATTSRGPGPAFVLDYELEPFLTNYILRCDTTYYAVGPILFRGSLAIEGGTVVKLARNASLEFYWGTLPSCQTSPYRPAIFTAKDDHTVGEQIGSDTLSGYYASTALILHDANHFLQHIRISHAGNAISLDDGDVTVRHGQFVNCQRVFHLTQCVGYLENVLAYSVSNVFSGGYLYSNSTHRAQHLTVFSCEAFSDASYSNATIRLTNCLASEMSSWGSATIVTNSVQVDAELEQVGAGVAYLPSGSAARNAGTTNITPALLADLRQRTTYPPVILTNRLTADLTLAPQAQRDTDIPDLGYLYAPIDYAVNVLNASNVVLTLTNGVVLASFGNAGVWLHDGATLISEGTPTARNHLTRFTCVQEQSLNWGSGEVNNYLHVNSYSYTTNRPSGRFRFTDFDVLATPYNLLVHGDVWSWRSLSLRDCELGAGALYLCDSISDSALAFTNNLFYRTWAYAWSDGTVFFFNNLFANAAGDLYNTGTNLTLARDNAFDSCLLQTIGVSNTHTAYINMTDRLDPTNSTDKVLASLAWQTGPLGRYYQPTNSALINAGSRYATNAGLYHYTTATNQVKEGTTTVDIGYHYIAVTNLAGAWVPIDTDGDGLPDYVEDADGDGLLDPAETLWQQYNSLNGLLGGSALQVFTPLK